MMSDASKLAEQVSDNKPQEPVRGIPSVTEVRHGGSGTRTFGVIALLVAITLIGGWWSLNRAGEFFRGKACGGAA
jgi:hypothetical protein